MHSKNQDSTIRQAIRLKIVWSTWITTKPHISIAQMHIGKNASLPLGTPSLDEDMSQSELTRICFSDPHFIVRAHSVTAGNDL